MSRHVVKGWSRMARGKRALFEVIQKDKRFQRPTPAPQAPVPIAPVAPIFRSVPVAPPVVVKKVGPPGPTVKERIWKAYREARARLQPQIDWVRPYAIKHGGVIIGVLAAFTLIGIVEIVRRTAHPAVARPAMMASIDDIRAQPVHPSVLQI